MFYSNRNKMFVVFSVVSFLVSLSLPCIAYSYAVPSTGSIITNFLEEVVGINMSRFSITSFSESDGLLSYSGSQTYVTVSDGHDEFNAQLIYVQGKLWYCTLNSASGSFGVGEKSLNECLSIAGRAVDRYQTIFNVSHLKDFAQMISIALQTQSLVVETSDALLNVSFAENGASYRNYAKINMFRKIDGQFITQFLDLAIHISKAGLVTIFADSIGVTRVSEGHVNTSMDTAVNIATPHIEDYASKHGQQLKETKATLYYVPDDNDRFTLYPVWSVEATFDKENEEGATGYCVSIRADTGNIQSQVPQGWYSSHGENDSTNIIWAFASITGTVAVLVGVQVLARRGVKTRRRRTA